MNGKFHGRRSKFFPQSFLVMSVFLSAASAPASLVNEIAQVRSDDDCSTVDLTRTLRKPKPLPDEQIAEEWCFLHGAADLIEDRYGVRLSILDLAIHYFRMFPAAGAASFPPTTERGGVATTINRVVGWDGICPAARFPHVPLKSCQARSSTALLLESSRDVSQGTTRDPRFTRAVLDRVFPQLSEDAKQRLMAGPTANRDLGVALVDAACESRQLLTPRPFAESRVVGRAGVQAANVVSAVDEQLDQRNMVSLAIKQDDENKPALNGGNAHTVTLVGRFRDSVSGACYYRFKDAAWKHRRKPSVTDSVAFKQDGPYTLVPRSQLSKITLQLTYLKAAPKPLASSAK